MRLETISQEKQDKGFNIQPSSLVSPRTSVCPQTGPGDCAPDDKLIVGSYVAGEDQ